MVPSALCGGSGVGMWEGREETEKKGQKRGKGGRVRPRGTAFCLRSYVDCGDRGDGEEKKERRGEKVKKIGNDGSEGSSLSSIT